MSKREEKTTQETNLDHAKIKNQSKTLEIEANLKIPKQACLIEIPHLCIRDEANQMMAYLKRVNIKKIIAETNVERQG